MELRQFGDCVTEAVVDRATHFTTCHLGKFSAVEDCFVTIVVAMAVAIVVAIMVSCEMLQRLHSPKQTFHVSDSDVHESGCASKSQNVETIPVN